MIVLPLGTTDVRPVYGEPGLPCVFLHIARLPGYCRPAQVIRDVDLNRSLLWVHPGTLRSVVALWTAENLTDGERRAFRLAYGISPEVESPPDDDLLVGRVSYLQEIPPILRLPRESWRARQRQRQSA